MKTTILFFTFIFLMIFIQVTNAQKYGNIWYFGNEAGIDFNQCTPVVKTNGHNPGFEGTATVCDSLGQLLFYTNSDDVWNKNHVAMQNGHLINSSGSLSQVLIVKMPMSDSLYYIFTTVIQGNLSQSLQYHIVDMSLNGGLGGVISKNNILVTNTISEQVAATYHANGEDIWIVVHEYNTNVFLSFLLTGFGLTPFGIPSPCGLAQGLCASNINARGEIKFSPDGSKIAFNGNGIGPDDSTNVLQLADFDNATGLVSNPLQLPFMRGDFGLSFSPDNSKLYGTTWKAFAFTSTDSNYLYQFDLSSGIDSVIINSRTILDATSISKPFGSVKIGPDGKVYVASNNSYNLGVINEPNNAGLACNYNPIGVYLNGKMCKFGLNNYIEYVNYNYPPIANASASDSVFCEKNCIDFTDLTVNNATSWQWFFPGADSTSSTLQNPTNICYNNYGNFDVTLIACNNVGCCDTVTFQNFIQCYQNPVDSVFQSNDTLYSLHAASYQWYETTGGIITGATDQFYVITQPGSYFCVITDSIGCVGTSNTIVITGLTDPPAPRRGVLAIVPNPNDGNFEIIFNAPSGDRGTLRILNTVGQIVFKTPLTSHFSLLTTHLKSGIYFVELNCNGNIFREKMVVKL